MVYFRYLWPGELLDLLEFKLLGRLRSHKFYFLLVYTMSLYVNMQLNQLFRVYYGWMFVCPFPPSFDGVFLWISSFWGIAWTTSETVKCMLYVHKIITDLKSWNYFISCGENIATAWLQEIIKICRGWSCRGFFHNLLFVCLLSNTL